MTLIKKSLILVLVIIGFTLINSQLQAQIPAQLQSCFKNGDSKKLAEYFNKNIELVVLDNDNVYSKAQAQQIVNKFFSPKLSRGIQHYSSGCYRKRQVCHWKFKD